MMSRERQLVGVRSNTGSNMIRRLQKRKEKRDVHNSHEGG